MLNDFKKIMKKLYGIENLELTSNFKTDFGLTSYDFMNLICLLEKKYKIEIDENEYQNINTVGELINYLEAQK